MTEEKKKEENKEEIQFTAKDGFVEDDDPNVDESEAEMLADFKAQKYGKLGTIIIVHPTVRDESAIDMAYSTEWNRLVRETDLMTSKQLERLYEKKGIWRR